MIYLDNASTTRVLPEVRDAMAAVPFANPSSIHAAGRAARKALEDAREIIADAYGGDPKGLVLTSGATEADNLAIAGAFAAVRLRGSRVLVSAVEHPAVLETAEALGADVVRIPVDGEGRVNAGDVERLATPGTVLISVMTGNNEVGTIQPVEEIAVFARERKIVFHTDAAQATGKIPFRFVGDLVTLSSHKMHGPRGAGALYVKPGTPLVARQVGGGQEFEYRAGTENIEAAIGFAAAVRIGERDRVAVGRRQQALRKKLEDGLRAAASPVRVNGGGLPHILNVSFPGVDGEAMVVALDARGVCVSSGSACASQSLVPSHVLTAMGRTPAETRSSIRFSFGYDTTDADVDGALAAVPAVVARLRAISAV